jgi:CheY-like chemotaxis protein
MRHRPAILGRGLVTGAVRDWRGGADGESGKDVAKVLIVDDDPNTVEILARAITFYGHQPERAFSSEEALQKVSDHPPEVVLLDLMVPGLGGYETLRRLRRIPGMNHLPVIVVTANAKQELEQQIRAAGVTAYLLKPVQLSVLAELITLSLEGRDARGPLPAAG